jgi:hypothetical protein
VEAVARVVQDEYVDADVGARASAALRRSLDEGRYADLSTAEALAARLTRDLLAVAHDKHLAVLVAPERGPEPSSPAPPCDASRRMAVRRANAGIQRIEILPGNVGYLDLRFLFRPEEARETLAAALQTLGRADALVLDLRSNGGGSPATAALVMSYMLDERGAALFEIVSRSGEVQRYATEAAELPGRDGARPLYVLTSAQTFSGGEGLAFLLQERRRGEVVGETTPGAANPGRPYPVSSGFDVIVPNGRLRSAVSGRSWEGTGVVPDVEAPAADALRLAHARALRRLLAAEPPGPWRETLEKALASLP